MDFKTIHIGKLIKQKVEEEEVNLDRILSFFKIDNEELILQMYASKDLSVLALLKWCKLLRYDFFRLYSHHLLLYKPQDSIGLQDKNDKDEKKSALPDFRKQLYTKEIIDFILEMIKDKKKTSEQVIEEYKIPKTTLYRWKTKYGKKDKNLIT